MVVAAGAFALRPASEHEPTPSAAAPIAPSPDPDSAPSVEGAPSSDVSSEPFSKSATLRVRTRSRPGGPKTVLMVLMRAEDAVHLGKSCDSLAASNLDVARFNVEMVSDRALDIPVAEGQAILARAGRLGSNVPEWLAAVPPLKPGETREIELRLPAETKLRGEVLDRETRASVPGARIEMLATWDEAAPDCPKAMTDAQGRFELPLHPPFARGRVQAAGYAPLLFPLRLDRGQDQPLTLELVRRAILVVQLTQSDSQPAVGWNVRAVTDETSRTVLAQAVTDSKGECEIDGRDSLSYLLEISRGESLVHREMVSAPPAGERRALPIRLPASARLQGRLVNEAGEPIAGESIWLSLGNIASTDPDGAERTWTSSEEASQPPVITGPGGEFGFDDLSPGLWWVGPSLSLAKSRGPAHGLAPLVQAIRIEPGTRLREIVLVGYRDLFIRGQVLAPDGSGAPRASVAALLLTWLRTAPQSHEGREVPSATADANGRFELGPLEPGSYDVEARDDRYKFSARMSAQAGGEPILLQLRPPDKPEVPATAQIRGQVIGDGELPEGTTIMLQISDAISHSRQQMPVPEDGRFVFHDLRPGRYDLSAVSPEGGLARSSVVLEAGQIADHMELRLALAGLLEVEVAGSILRPRVSVRGGPDSDQQCTRAPFRAGPSFRCVVGAEPVFVEVSDGASFRVVRSIPVQLRSDERRTIRVSVNP